MTAGRKRPVVLRPVARHTGRDAVWAVIRDLAAPSAPPFTVRDIERRIVGGKHLVRDYLRLLVRAGIVAQVDPPGRQALATYRLAQDRGAEAPRITPDGRIDDAPTGQERLWQAMKALPSFSVVELQVCTGIASVRTIGNYLSGLTRAAYVQRLSDGGTRARFRLPERCNTGPRAPVIRRDGSVFDANLGRQVWPEAAP